MEKKSDKFKRLAEQRTNKIISMASLLSNLSNKRNYEYTDEEVTRMFNAIDKELKKSKARFTFERKSKEFKL